MTISEYYITFGFKIKLTSLMRKEGYAVERLTDQLRAKYREECNDPDDNEQIVVEWFNQEFFSTAFSLSHGFKIGDVEFIIRTFTHDNEDDHGTYAILGVDIGTIKKFRGTLFTTDTNGTDNLKHLVKDLAWAALIVESSNSNAYCGRPVDYGVADPKYSTLSIVPSIFITTDDCDCCS